MDMTSMWQCAHRTAWCAALVVAAVVPWRAGGAQRVLLEVRPRPGDTLHVLLDHSVTVTIPGLGRGGGAADSSTTYATSYRIVTRDVVERADANGTIVHAIVDSVHMRTTGSIGASPFPGVDRGMEGMQVRLHVLPDGSSRVIEGLEQLDHELRAVLGAMPAVLPTVPVRVRESWTRDLPLPATGDPGGSVRTSQDKNGGGATGGVVRVTFRLDSLTSNGDLAWISLHGRVVPPVRPPGGSATGAAKPPELSGGLTGQLRLDRRRGWLAESSATVSVESLVALPGGGAPYRVRVRVNQVMRTAPARR